MRAQTSVPRVGLRARVRGVFYGWWLVGIAAFMLTLMALTVFQGLGTFVVALQREFGWTRTALSGAFALSRAEGAVLGPVEGYLIDRIGTRHMVLVGYIVMGAGFLLLSQVNTLWQFYLAFMVVTMGGGLGGFLPLVAAVNNWFQRRRTLAMSIAMSGVNFAGLLVPMLAFGLESHGFRWTTGGIGVILIAVAFPAYKFIRNRPEEHGLRPDGEQAPAVTPRGAGGPESAAAAVEQPDITPRQALRTAAFWILTISNIASGVAVSSLVIHLVPKLTDMGFSLGTASVVVTTVTASAIPTMFVAGVLGDRLPKPLLLCAVFLLQGSAIMVLAIFDSMVWAWVFAPLYGIAFGGRIPLVTALRSEFFGRKSFATISGLSQFPASLATMGGPVFAGYLFDIRGSYFVPFLAFSILSFIGAVVVLFARQPRVAGPTPGARA